MNQSDLSIAKTYKDALIDLGLPISNFYVFGSRATGHANKWSDLDICVVCQLFSSDRQANRSLLLSVSRPISEDIEPHPMTQEDLADRFNSLANEVRKYGVAV